MLAAMRRASSWVSSLPRGPSARLVLTIDEGERLLRTERSLYERANGYNYAVKIFMPAGSKQPVVVHYIEHCPPDVGAAFIWLKNRDPERWRDVQNVEHVLGKYIISDKPMTEEEWARERATLDVTPEK
jgi:hypothetical protein